MTAPDRIAALRNLILQAKHAYYYSQSPLMSDAEYDALEDELRGLSPQDPVLALVGAPVPPESMLTKAAHRMAMGSQSKVNSEAELRAWLGRIGNTADEPLHLSLKGDGASAAAYYDNGRLHQAISRGDGLVGEDITANALRFKGLPAWAGSGVAGGGFWGAVRFEVILTVADWAQVDPARSTNPRNAGTGIMGRKNGYQSDCLSVFAFDLEEQVNGQPREFATESAKMARLAELGFQTIAWQCVRGADAAVAWFEQVRQQRESLPFWIDGVVIKLDDLARQQAQGVTAGRPKGQVAWKFDSSGAESVLQGVLIGAGHTGGLFPTAQLRPVQIGGTTVSSASLANFDEIARLDVAIGDSVWVIKANDIIPKIIRVTERPAHRQAIEVPSACPFCGGAVGRRRISSGDEGVVLECRNADCPKKSSGKISRWIASLDILGIGDAVLLAMIERFDLADAADLYSLHTRADELAELVINTDNGLRLGAKRSGSILAAIEATRCLSLAQFLGSLGLEQLGQRRVELMIHNAAGPLDDLAGWRSGWLRDAEHAALAGVPTLGAVLQNGLDSAAGLIERLLANGVRVLPTVRPPATNTAANPTVCISGKLPSGKKKADYAAPLQAAGFTLVDEVSKGLRYLVLADPASGSSKAQKAAKLGIEVISEDQLQQRLLNPDG